MKRVYFLFKYIILFFLVFCIYVFVSFPNTYGDPINNYMFSHALLLKEVLYQDFNMISTPLYPFLMSLGLIIFDNYLMFIFEQSILVVLLFYFLFKLYGKKSFLVLLTIVLFGFFPINPTYNFFTFFLLVFLLFLEEKFSDKDFLIGFTIGCCILSKHTIGILFILPSLIFYYKNLKKLKMRFVGLMIPCILFLGYLLYNNCFFSFINLCFLGLFDFSTKNGGGFSNYIFFSILIFVIQLIITLKNKKNIRNYYLLMGIGFVIPIFDIYHFSIYVVCFVIQLLDYLKAREDYFGLLGLVCSIFIIVIIFINYYLILDPVFSKKIPKFEYTLQSSYDYYNSVDNYHFFDQYDSKIILSPYSVQYNVSRDNLITYFDILMYGNYGFRGSYRMIEEIKKLKNIYIIVDMECYEDNSFSNQFDKIVIEYIINQYDKVKSWKNFAVYYVN